MALFQSCLLYSTQVQVYHVSFGGYVWESKVPFDFERQHVAELTKLNICVFIYTWSARGMPVIPKVSAQHASVYSVNIYCDLIKACIWYSADIKQIHAMHTDKEPAAPTRQKTSILWEMLAERNLKQTTEQ